jgi:hypothetical protein
MTMALEIKLVTRYTGIDISDDEMDKLELFVSWTLTPHFPRRGRMAWHAFSKTPTDLVWPNRRFAAAKIKGVGVYNPPDEAGNRDPIYSSTTQEPLPPTTTPLTSFATYPHLGFHDNGDFAVVLGATAPIGGITVQRALREFNMAAHLHRNNVPTIVPIAVYQYLVPEYVFDNQPLGAVICAVPDDQPYRLSEIQFGGALNRGADSDRDRYYDRVRRALGIVGDASSEETRNLVLQKISYQVGQRVAQFSRSGLFRYSGELPNFDFDFHEGIVILTDLDSSVLLNEIPISRQRMEVLRDLASAVYHLVAKFATPRALGAYSIESLLLHDPAASLLQGYFGSDSMDEWRPVTARLWRAFIPHFQLINKYKTQIAQTWDSERRRSYKLDHHLFFVLVICEVYEAFCKSDLSTLVPDDSLTMDSLLQRAERFLGKDFDYLQYLRQQHSFGGITY